MAKRYIFLYIFCLSVLFSSAQNDIQTSIATEDGIFTISQTDDGKDMLIFSTALWDDMVKGTKYHSQNMPVLIATRICIQITSKERSLCKTGIGFRCGIFDCINKETGAPALVNDKNRICAALIQKQGDSAIKIIFLDRIDWCSLQSGQ